MACAEFRSDKRQDKDSEDIQPKLIRYVAKSTEELTKEDFGVTAPGIEIAQMKHERLNIRIFMS